MRSSFSLLCTACAAAAPTAYENGPIAERASNDEPFRGGWCRARGTPLGVAPQTDRLARSAPGTPDCSSKSTVGGIAGAPARRHGYQRMIGRTGTIALSLRGVQARVGDARGVRLLSPWPLIWINGMADIWPRPMNPCLSACPADCPRSDSLSVHRRSCSRLRL